MNETPFTPSEERSTGCQAQKEIKLKLTENFGGKFESWIKSFSYTNRIQSERLEKGKSGNLLV